MKNIPWWGLDVFQSGSHASVCRRSLNISSCRWVNKEAAMNEIYEISVPTISDAWQRTYNCQTSLFLSGEMVIQGSQEFASVVSTKIVKKTWEFEWGRMPWASLFRVEICPSWRWGSLRQEEFFICSVLSEETAAMPPVCGAGVSYRMLDCVRRLYSEIVAAGQGFSMRCAKPLWKYPVSVFVQIRICVRCVSIFVDLFLEQVKESPGSIGLVSKLTISNIYEMWLEGRWWSDWISSRCTRSWFGRALGA